jgi:DNA-binding protein HU-beta
MGRNPRTGEQIRIKASKRVRVSPMKAFKDTVMAPAQAPRLARGVWPTSPELLTNQAAERKTAAGSDGRRPATRAASGTATPAKRATAKKTVAKKTTVKKTTVKRAAPAKKAPAKKVTATRATAKKAPAKRTAVKKAPAKKAPAKRAAARR